MDDLVSIDIAMLNVSKAPVYVNKSTPDSLRIRVMDASGASIDVRRYILVSRTISPESFELLESMQPLWNGSLLLLAGCESDELKRYFIERDKLLDDEKHGADYPLEAYRRGLYANYGEACLNLKPGTYRVVVTASNDYVIIDRRRPHVRTAVGDLRSNELVICVVESGAAEPPPN